MSYKEGDTLTFEKNGNVILGRLEKGYSGYYIRDGFGSARYPYILEQQGWVLTRIDKSSNLPQTPGQYRVSGYDERYSIDGFRFFYLRSDGVWGSLGWGVPRGDEGDFVLMAPRVAAEREAITDVIRDLEEYYPTTEDNAIRWLRKRYLE